MKKVFTAVTLSAVISFSACSDNSPQVGGIPERNEVVETGGSGAPSSYDSATGASSEPPATGATGLSEPDEIGSGSGKSDIQE